MEVPTEYGETVRFFRSIAPKTAIALFLRFAVSRGCRFHRRATGKTKSTGAPVTKNLKSSWSYKASVGQRHWPTAIAGV